MRGVCSKDTINVNKSKISYNDSLCFSKKLIGRAKQALASFFLAMSFIQLDLQDIQIYSIPSNYAEHVCTSGGFDALYYPLSVKGIFFASTASSSFCTLPSQYQHYSIHFSLRSSLTCYRILSVLLRLLCGCEHLLHLRRLMTGFLPVLFAFQFYGIFPTTSRFIATRCLLGVFSTLLHLHIVRKLNACASAEAGV